MNLLLAKLWLIQKQEHIQICLRHVKNFAQTYNLSRDSFILTNGCENAVRIIFEALRPKYAYIENPSWGLVEVLANGLLYPRPEKTPEEKRIFSSGL